MTWLGKMVTTTTAAGRTSHIIDADLVVYLIDLALLGLILGLGFTVGFGPMVMVQLPIVIIASTIGVWLFSVQHRFEQALWARQEAWHPVSAALEGSSYLELPRILQWFTGNIGFHHVHHLNPRIPSYRLEACHGAIPALQTAYVMKPWHGLRAWRSALWDERTGRMVQPRQAQQGGGRAAKMIALTIWHKTTYRYRRPLTLGIHRLQLRPRESHAFRVLSTDIAVTPSVPLIWANDVFGNAIATASFPTPVDTLIVESRVVLEHHSEPWPLFDIASSPISYPFQYSDDEKLDLGALLIPQHADPDRRLLTWAKGFVHSAPTDTLSLLKEVNAAISAWVAYQSRDDEGKQPPIATLDRGWGSCRGIALLLIEAVRRLGFGARIVSGYLANRTAGLAF